MKTLYICIGLIIGFVVGLIGASFVVDMMSR
jgi:nitrate/nitrite transporter NarK